MTPLGRGSVSRLSTISASSGTDIFHGDAVGAGAGEPETQLTRAHIGDTAALCLGLCAVLPQYQKTGVGSAAIRAAFEAAAARGEHFVTVLGHPEYCRRQQRGAVDLADRRYRRRSRREWSSRYEGFIVRHRREGRPRRRAAPGTHLDRRTVAGHSRRRRRPRRLCTSIDIDSITRVEDPHRHTVFE